LGGTSDLLNFAQKLSSSNIGLVFSENSSSICLRERLDVLGCQILNKFLIVSVLFVFLDLWEMGLSFLFFFLILFIFFCSLSIKFFFFNFICLAYLLVFLSLGVFSAIDPLHMVFSIVILWHQALYLVETFLILSLLFWIFWRSCDGTCFLTCFKLVCISLYVCYFYLVE